MRNKLSRKWASLALGLIGLCVFNPAALAADHVSVVIGHKGSWDSMIPYWGTKAGIFQKHGLDLDFSFSSGGAETIQAIGTGSADIGTGAGIMGVVSAYEKGFPIRIVTVENTGASDLYYYVKDSSPIQSMADMNGKTMGYSRPGSSSQLVAIAIAKDAGVKPKFVSAGGISATLTQVMTGQIDVGWAPAPKNIDRVEKGDIRIIAEAKKLKELSNLTVRTNIVNAAYLEDHKDVISRFAQAYKETVDWMYSSDEAVKMYAELNDVSVSLAKKARVYYPKASVEPTPIKGLDQSMAEAVRYKRLSKPLSQDQLDDLIQIPDSIRE